MRPLRMELKGFTAFRDAAEIDFTALDVFAISGPTGSGKSSLLDAMTYALYGRVDRVGDRVSQLISQGQPRMAVTLEYEVGRDRYRVTRSTPSGRGPTKIMLERLDDGGDWRQAGEGADRVREAEQLIARSIGLTYDGFTRSILLPQGKFAEFLTGDRSTRRAILTELLGLSLFRRMAERAGAIARESSVRADTMSGMLERDYADVTPATLKEARSAAREAARLEKALATAAEQVVDVLRRWQEIKGSIEQLRSCAREAEAAAGDAGAAAEELDSLAEEMADAVASAEVTAAAARDAEHAFVAAQAAHRDGAASLGSADDLSRARVGAHAMAEAIRVRNLSESQRSAATTSVETLQRALADAERTVAAGAEALAVRNGDLEGAEAALEKERHADLVGAVSAGLKAGDPCPVCGALLPKAPKKLVDGSLDRAAKRMDIARKALEDARRDIAASERAADDARRDLKANDRELDRLSAEIDELDAQAAKERSQLAAVLGDPFPDDPAAAIDDRLAKLQRLDRAERDAATAAAGAAQAALKAEQHRDRIAGQIELHRDRLAVNHQPLFERAARAVGKKVSPVTLPVPPVASAPAALQNYAVKLAGALATFAERLAREVDDRASGETRLLQEANDRVAGVLEPAGSLEALAKAIDAACKAATAEVARAAQRATDLKERLSRKEQFAEEGRQLEARAVLFRALARELQADHLIAFLQAEALQVLAAAGSQRLASLSDGRYRLACRDDEFFVLDTWNGDEERSVRTLSGGETFLASLSLALALADQVRSLSVTDCAPLDSLFLDEGFGTLDQETLRTVVDAIGQLGADGRLVGVITHVRELAEEFPRIEVQKSPRGSRLQLVAS